MAWCAGLSVRRFASSGRNDWRVEYEKPPAQRLHELFGSRATYYRPLTKEVVLSCTRPRAMGFATPCASPWKLDDHF